MLELLQKLVQAPFIPVIIVKSGSSNDEFISPSPKDSDIHITRQILINGYYDMYSRLMKPHSEQPYAAAEKEDFLMPQSMIEFQFAQLGLTDSDLRNPLIASPLLGDLSDLPPTTVIVAEYDALRSDSKRLILALQKQGNQLEHILIPGQTHNTMILRDKLADGPDPSSLIAKNILRYSNNI